MTKEEKLDCFLMRLDGYTYKQIADKYGVSKQCIQQALTQITNKEAKPNSKDKYCNLSRWMKTENQKRYAVAQIIGITPYSFSRKINGKSEFKLSEIKKILQFTGMTFEEAFREEKQEG